jgi:hypothetical protein
MKQNVNNKFDFIKINYSDLNQINILYYLRVNPC